MASDLRICILTCAFRVLTVAAAMTIFRVAPSSRSGKKGTERGPLGKP